MNPARLATSLVLIAIFSLAIPPGGFQASAKADTAALFTDALMAGDTQKLEQLLAPNFWYIGANGHIRDKENFIRDIRDKNLVVDLISLGNIRETGVGNTRLITANGRYQGSAAIPVPQGLMRFSLVLAENRGEEEVALFQATPVISTPDCQDGNCRIK